MDFYIITKEKMRSAKDYMPLSVKCDLAQKIADHCVVEAGVAEKKKKTPELLVLPRLQEENSQLKNILLLNTLLGYYFDVDVEKTQSEYGFADSSLLYDFFAGAHVLNQIERFKSDAELKNKAFDLLADYKDFRKIVETEIYNRKNRGNDALSRLDAALAILGDPETVKEWAELLRIEGEKVKDSLQIEKVSEQ